MARQSGPIKYVGTLGDIRHFKIKGQRGHFAGLKGGPSGEQVRNGEEFARTRKNMSEFAACAMAGKSVRIALSTLLKHMADRQLTGRLTAIMKRINLEDGSEARGRRAIELTNAPQHLVGLNLNDSLAFDTVFRADYSVTATAERNASQFSTPAFTPANALRMPAGATHFRLVHALAAVSNFSYNEETGGYEADEPDFHEIAAIGHSDYLPGAGATSAITVEAAFAGAPAVPGDVAILACIGIEFFQKVGANYYLLNSGNSLKIETVV